MSERTLLIDQGNTRLKWMPALGDQLLTDSAGHGDPDSFREAVASLARPPEAVLLAGVADPEQKQGLADFCRRHWKIEPRLLVSRQEQGGVRNAYSEPATLGVDRWLAIVGAANHHGMPVVIWDLGTASTLDAVSAQGQHLGGLIYPGPATMLRSLQRDTRLSVPDGAPGASPEEAGTSGPGVAPGTSTSDCIGRGVLAAQLGALNQFMRSVSSSGGAPPRLVVTGGAAEPILPVLDFPVIHDPWLVFRGMLVE
jgi:type III pantothenate kinase